MVAGRIAEAHQRSPWSRLSSAGSTRNRAIAPTHRARLMNIGVKPAPLLATACSRTVSTPATSEATEDMVSRWSWV